MSVTLIRLGRAATGGRGSGRGVALICAGSSIFCAQWLHGNCGVKISSISIALNTAFKRNNQREAMVGAPPNFSARVIYILSNENAATKSCADRPTRRSGAGKPICRIIWRLTQASACGICGHTPSLRPPKMAMSKSASRASIAPKIANPP